MKKKFLAIPLFIFGLILFSQLTKVEAVDCRPGECGSWYECDGGDMCCTGGGCPSWVCKKEGGSWNNATQQCKKCVTEKFYTCVKYESYIDDYKWKCKTVPCAYGASDQRENVEVSEKDVLGDAIAYIPSDSCTACGWYPVYKKKCVEKELDFTIKECWWESPDSGDKCRYCEGEITPPDPTCEPSAISGVPGLSSPANGADFDSTTTTVRLQWTEPSSWGKCCESCARQFQVWVRTNGGAFQQVTTVGSAVKAYNLPVSEGNSYSWYIRATNGDATAARSVTRNFEVLEESPRVSGYIWDSTNLACTGGKVANEIVEADLENDVAVSVGGVDGIWDPSGFGSYSYVVDGLTNGNNQTICASMPAPADKPNFKYSLSCLNNSDTGIISGACATVNVSGSTTAHLGFELTSSGWFHVFDGDVYGGCDECVDSISLGIPNNPLGGFLGYLVDAPGTVFNNSNLSVVNGDGDNRYVSGGNEYYTENMESNFWQDSFKFEAPSGAETVSGGNDCRDMLSGGFLEAGKAYSVTRQCMQRAINNLSGNYAISGAGVAVIYVEADGTSLFFDEDFRSQNRNNKRIAIITEEDVDFDSDLGYLSPIDSSRPNVEAAIITKGSINFLSTGSSDDSTVIVEGPLVTKEGSIDFGRDRGLDNGYPAEVVVYNPIYLTAFEPEDETGLGLIDVTWTILN